MKYNYFYFPFLPASSPFPSPKCLLDIHLVLFFLEPTKSSSLVGAVHTHMDEEAPTGAQEACKWPHLF